MELKASELRQRNLVEYNGEFLEIAAINADDTVRLWKDGKTIGCFTLSQVKAVLLTEERLLKFGLTKLPKSHNQFVFSFNTNGTTSFELTPDGDDGYDLFIRQWCDDDDDRIDVIFHSTKTYYFVHEIQNLYFALTNQELTINQ